MTVQHHGEGVSPEFRKLFVDEAEARKRLQAQRDGTAVCQYSDGKIAPLDEGDLALEVGTQRDKQLVYIDFGKQVVWLALSPQQAVDLAQSLIRQARSIATEPLQIVLH